MTFQQSQTKLNLMRAFSGESQARNRYTFAAQRMKKLKLPVLERLFLFTADQEKEHANLFYNQLKQVNGENILTDGAYPVGNYDNALELLTSAQHNELQEYEVDYPAFAQIARQEGFGSVATLLTNIAAIEKTHAERFGYYADLFTRNLLFSDPAPVQWLCLNCGHVHEGTAAPEVCPVCLHEQGYYVRRAF